MKRAGIIASLLAASLLAACSFRPPPKPEYFLLDAGRPPKLEAFRPNETGATAAVSFVDVAAPFAADGFVYQVSGGRWEVDPYNQFLVSPADMMTSILRNWARGSGLYGDVAMPGTGGGQDFLIDCDLTELYGDFRDPARPRAVLTIEAQVFKRTDKGRVLALRKTFTQAAPVAERTPRALVAAWNDGLRVELHELLRELAQLEP